MSGTVRFGRWIWLWACCYVVLQSAVVWSTFASRHWALDELATPRSIGDWQAWREDVRRQQDEPAPVERRVPQSDEPPALVLLRDYFPALLTAAVVFTTLLYWMAAWMTMGMVQSDDAPSVPGRPTERWDE